MQFKSAWRNSLIVSLLVQDTVIRNSVLAFKWTNSLPWFPLAISRICVTPNTTENLISFKCGRKKHQSRNDTSVRYWIHYFIFLQECYFKNTFVPLWRKMCYFMTSQLANSSFQTTVRFPEILLRNNLVAPYSSTGHQ